MDSNNYNNNNMSTVNGAPPYQNRMFPNFFHNPYHYQPLIHVPTRTSAVTLGEMGALVDMMRAQMAEFSRRMDAMDSTFSEFKISVSNDIFLLKNTLSEHSTELLNARDCVEDTRLHVKKTKEVIEEQDACIDKLADAVRQNITLHKKQQHQKKTVAVASKIDLGIVRRRLSKMEDFTNEFYEQFESFKSIKDIITSLSEHIDECDQDITSFIVNVNKNDKLQEKVDASKECISSHADEHDDNNNDDDFEHFEPIID